MTADKESIWLSESDIYQLTEKKTRACQVRELKKIGVPFILNASGRPLVPKDWINGGKTERKKEKWQPNGLNT